MFFFGGIFLSFGKSSGEFGVKHVVKDFGKILNFVFVLKIHYFSLLKSHPLVNPRKQTSWKVKMSMMSKRNLPFCSFLVFSGV